MRRYSELFKTLCITLLSVSALFLLGSTLIAEQDILPDSLYARASAPSLRWLGISGVTAFDGTARIGALYDGDAQDICISTLSESISRTLDTAETPTEALENEWRLALATRCVYVTLRAPLPARILWHAFGADGAPALTVSAFAITPDGDTGTAKLLLKTEDKYYRAATALPADAIGSLSEQGAPIRLAAELGEPYTGVLPSDTLLSDEIGFPVYELSHTFSFGPADFNRISPLLTAFSVDPYSDSGYRDALLNRIYKSDYGTLSISPEGLVSFFTAAGDTGIPCPADGEDAMLTALNAAVGLLESALGSEENFHYRLESVIEAGDSYIFLFDAALDGIPLLLDGKLLQGQISVEGGRIIQATFQHLSSTESLLRSDGVLTGRQAYAVFCSEPRGRTLRLVYTQEGNAAVPSWITSEN